MTANLFHHHRATGPPVSLGRAASLPTFVVFTVLLASATPSGAADSHNVEFFESKVRPLLVEHCYECHSAESGESSGDLRLDTAAATRNGGSRGPALVPGRPDESLIIRAVEYEDFDMQMPPAGKLDDAAIEVLRHWVQSGATDPRSAVAEPKKTSPLDREPETHWAFVAPETPAAPAPQAVAASGAATSLHDPIDAYAAVRASEKNIPPVAQADNETLIRRLYFDLVGLPPSRQQIERYVHSDRTDKYVRLVDELLSNPAFGERFGRHWLDVARYADTIGYTVGGRERRLEGSERYRDWTIHAFASDMPYDEMVRHQLAGDRTDPKNERGNLDAMGFLTVGRRFLNSHDITDDRIDVITRGLLGMTVACARCHDHKFDPIPTTDYYSLYGILRSSEHKEDGPSPLMMVDKEKPRDHAVFLRGQPGNRGPVAPRQYLTALREPGEPRFTDGSGRWELAQKIASQDNPLTARVMVNRIWDHLIGKPLIDTPSDFGFRTQPPAVPGVLEDLAVDFSSHWSIKRMVRRIVLSRIYRQTSDAPPAVVQADPENRLLTRANRSRRDFESMRDSMLAVADMLDRRISGQPVEITSPSVVPRRTLYAMIDRQNLPSLFRTFDFASPDAHAPERYYTTVPQQALFLLNNEQSFELARRTAAVVRRKTSGEATGLQQERVQAIFCRVLGRQATADELAEAVAFVQAPVAELPETTDPRALWEYGIGHVEDGQVTGFQPLATFKDNRWQVDGEFPSKTVLAYANLDADGGHPGGGDSGAVVRRWTAPASGTVEIRGVVEHPSENGDGVIASVHVGTREVFRQTRKNGKTDYGPLTAEVKEGETIDFAASRGETLSHDGFRWRAEIRLTSDEGDVITADSKKDFSGPVDRPDRQPLDRLQQLAQVLLMSNEFAFVD